MGQQAPLELTLNVPGELIAPTDSRTGPFPNRHHERQSHRADEQSIVGPGPGDTAPAESIDNGQSGVTQHVIVV